MVTKNSLKLATMEEEKKREEKKRVKDRAKKQKKQKEREWKDDGQPKAVCKGEEGVRYL